MPLDPKLNKFTTTSPVVASYDYTDLASGLGYEVFEGFATTVTTPTITYHLGEAPILSQPSSTGNLVNNATTTDTNTFKTTAFNVARIVRGDVYVQISHSCDATSFDGTSTLTVTIQHYDGGTTTVTDLGSAECPARTAGAGAGRTYWGEYMTISLTEKPFKVGDKLYIKVEQEMVASGVGNRNFTLHHDPLNTTLGSSEVISTLKIQVPFKLESSL